MGSVAGGRIIPRRDVPPPLGAVYRGTSGGDWNNPCCGNTLSGGDIGITGVVPAAATDVIADDCGSTPSDNGKPEDESEWKEGGKK